MFPLPRPHRQVAATALVLLVTVAPTLYVGLTAWRIRRPSHRAEVAAEIGRALGVSATLDEVRYPRPGEVEYRGLVLRRAEPNGKGLVELARVERLRVRRFGRELALETEALVLHGESPRAVLNELGSLLQRSGEVPFERIGFTAPSCLVELGEGVRPYHLREVAGDFHADPFLPTTRASYRLVGRESSTRCEVVVTRDRKAVPARTTVALKTMEGLPLPASVLDPFLEPESWLGRDAKVEGHLSLEQVGSREWEASFQGHLLDIDLAELVGRRFPNQKLSGRARLEIDRARWGRLPGQGQGWVEARGELTAGPGVIGLGLVQALATEMKFRRGTRLGRLASSGIVDLDFRALGLRFAMSSDGQIDISGALGTEFEGDAVVAGATGPLVYAPEGAAHVRGLIKTLFPMADVDTRVMVPLTEKSRIMLSLPVGPDVASRPLGGN